MICRIFNQGGKLFENKTQVYNNNNHGNFQLLSNRL